ncbi:MAG: TIGR03086 family metal-binding protein [Actinomycetota bacterium]|nr:TIGR03086 family metal-binding protein [Actinomycetota bacterium]
MLDLKPATTLVTEIVEGIRDDQLDDPTPCTDTSVGELLNHLLGLTVAFRDAAGKIDGPTTSTPPAKVSTPLPDNWRQRLRTQLDEVARAWGDPMAWDGMTMAGGVQLPAEVAGLVTLNEVQMHGWDLARATGQRYQVDDELAEAVLPIVTPTGDAADDAAREGMFGAPVDVPEDAPTFDRALGLAGRDPNWSRG